MLRFYPLPESLIYRCPLCIHGVLFHPIPADNGSLVPLFLFPLTQEHDLQAENLHARGWRLIE